MTFGVFYIRMKVHGKTRYCFFVIIIYLVERSIYKIPL